MRLFSAAGRVPLLLLYADRDNTDDMKAVQAGSIEETAFQGLNVCGWSHRGDLSLCSHSVPWARGPP